MHADPLALRLYRFADAPPALRALSDAGGGEVLVCVVPVGWDETHGEVWLSYVLWLLLEAPLETHGSTTERLWGRVQRVAQEDGSRIVIVSRP